MRPYYTAMKTIANRPTVLFSLVLVFATSAHADDGEWEYRLTPYLWLPTIDGSIKYSVPPSSGPSPEFSVGPTDWLDLLNYGLLLSGSASKDRLTLFSDVVVLSMTSKNDGRVLSVDDTITVPGTRIPIPISADAVLASRTDLDGIAWTFAAGYDVMPGENASMVAFAGARLFSVDVKSSWELEAEISIPGAGVVLPAQGQVGADVDLWDAIVGVRGEIATDNGKWSIPYYVDVGSGDSDLTWSGMVAAARKFGWGDLVIAYRHLEYDQGDDDLIQGFSFSGPIIGARFNFE